MGGCFLVAQQPCLLYAVCGLSGLSIHALEMRKEMSHRKHLYMCIILLCVDVCQFKLTHPTFKNLHPPTKLSYFFYPLPHLPVDVKNG